MRNAIDCRKIVILGNPGVGKTSIIQRYVHNQFKELYDATLGFNIYTRYIDIADKRVGLSIWDVGGQEAFRKFAFRYLIEADAAIFVSDVTQPQSLDDLAIWNEKLDQVSNRKIPKIILFNKIDLDYDVDTLTDRLLESNLRSFINGIVFASAKTGRNVLDIFSMIAKMLTSWDEEFGVQKNQRTYFNGSFDGRNLPIMFFSNSECDWCKSVFDNITLLASEFPLNIIVIDTDLDGKTTKDLGIQSLPTTIIGSKTIVGDSDMRILRSIVTDECLRLFSI
ncbi:MAG: GTP-binding protein [Asgard group archaeon]|nr:GTP-binding protein [Asgard group archaeon]